MEIVSDTIVDGRRKLVLKYTEEEKEVMRLLSEQHMDGSNRRRRKKCQSP